VNYRIVFVPRQHGGSLAEAAAAVDSGAGVTDADRLRWFDRLAPAVRSVLDEVELDAAGRSLTHSPTGIRVGVRAGGVVIEVPYEGEADPVTLMTLMHALAGDVERATGLVGWDLQLAEPVSTRMAASPRTVRRPQPTDGDDDGDEDGGGRARATPDAVRPPPQPPSPPRQHSPWWRFWARR
jgi:hypothetical protein